jgi:type I restriction enzyme S subunit
VLEQRKLEKFISLLDRRIATQSGLINKLESLISGIIERLTAQSPNTRIADCLECHSSILQEKQLNDTGGYRVYGANGICGYTDSPAINADAILIVKDGSGVGNVSYAQGEYSVIGTSNYLTAKNGYSLRYLYYSLMKFNFAPYKTGMAIPHIYFKDYGKAKIYCPSLEEQERIASNLFKIERKIEIERSIKDCCIAQKQYLLQQMFI